MTKEEWREVPGFSGFKASSFGRIWRDARNVMERGPFGRMRQVVEVAHIVTPQLSEGYERINVGLRRVLVHHMVLMAFEGPQPAGMIGRHLDDNRRNNRIDNLRWGTHDDNMADRKRNGRYASGRAHHMAKFGEKLLDDIRQGLVGRKEALEAGMSASHYYRTRKQGAALQPRSDEDSVTRLRGIAAKRVSAHKGRAGIAKDEQSDQPALIHKPAKEANEL